MMLGKSKDLRRREVWWCSECPLDTILSCRNGLPTRRGLIRSCSPEPSGAGRTERVVAPLDVCWTQGEPHSRQLVPFRGVRFRPEPRHPPSNLSCRHHRHASPRWCHDRGGAVAFPGRRVGPSECSQVGASGFLGVLGRLLVAGPCPGTRGVHTASPGVGRTAIQSTVCSGSPTRCRSADGMEVPEWPNF